MQYELYLCEKLILQDLFPKPAQPPALIFYVATIAEVHQEKARILRSFNNLPFHLKSNQGITRGIQTHQRKLILLADKVCEQLTDKDILNITAVDDTPSWTNLYKIVYSTLIELLTFIETTHVEYLDIHAKVPVAYLLSARQALRHTLPSLLKRLAAASMDPALLSIIRQPFQDFMDGGRSIRITYHGMFYLKGLSEGLSKLVQAATVDINQAVQNLLLELNFNNPEYYAYCTAAIKREIAALPLKDRLEQLIWMQKQVNQRYVQPGRIYRPLDTGLQQQLQHWFAEEIACLKEVYQLSHNSPGPTQEEILRWKNFKVLTRFSVAQMANMIKLLTDSELFLNKNKTELLEFYSFFYATINQDHISPGSLRKNFYAEDAAVSDGLRNILIQLINQSKKGLL